MPLRFSILTPTLDRRQYLTAALQSVTAQKWPNVEHIIADGGSTDGTRAVLATRGGVRLLEGNDNGIYEGLNKLVVAATGDVVGWLNSDDLYADGVFAAAAALFESDHSIDAVCGGACIEMHGLVERVYPASLVADLRPGALLIGPTLPNAWFFRNRVFEKVGPFQSALRFSADGDFMMRFARMRPKIAASDMLFYRYQRHEHSATIGTRTTRVMREDMLSLACAWRNDSEPAVRQAARALEGRCRAALALLDISTGDIRPAVKALRFAPTMAHGVWDFGRRHWDVNLRRRRAGISPNP